MRQRRIDRANDLAHKHVSIPEHMWNHQGKPFDPKNMYLTYVYIQIQIQNMTVKIYLNRIDL